MNIELGLPLEREQRDECNGVGYNMVGVCGR